MVLFSVSRFTTRQARPVSPEAASRRPPVPSVTNWFQPRLGVVAPLYFTWV